MMPPWRKNWGRCASEWRIVGNFGTTNLPFSTRCMITLDNFEETISSEIVKRGKGYFQNGAVTCFEEVDTGSWEAEVEGSDTYQLEILLEGRTVKEYDCDCPYDGGECKHLVAVLYELRKEIKKNQTTSTPKKTKKLTLESLLDKISLKELQSFILEYAASDKTFSQKFELHFAEKDDRIDVRKKYTDLINKIFRTHSDRGYIGYNEARKVSRELDKLVQMGYQYASNDNFKDALTVGQVLLVELRNAYEEADDSAGELGGVFYDIAQLLDAIATSEASLELKEELLEFLAKELQNQAYFSYGDGGHELLGIIPKVALALGDPDMYLTALDRIERNASSYLKESLKATRINFLRSIGRTEAVNREIEANMDIPQIRQGVVDSAMNQKDYEKAKSLIREGILVAERVNHFGAANNWEKQLMTIAELENDTSQIRLLAKKFAFDRVFNLSYYRQWKKTFPTAEWEKEIEAHIQKARKDIKNRPKQGFWSGTESELFRVLSPIFIEEKKWPQLLESVQKEPKLEALNVVLPYLGKLYPKELLALYLPLLDSWGKRVSTRPDYANLANQMKLVKKEISGSGEAIDQLVIALKEQNPRRPAMQEELNKVLRSTK